MTLAAYLELVDRHGAPALPVSEWRRQLGDELLGRLRRQGWLESRSLRLTGWYPCPSPSGDGCPREVIELGGRLVAVCGRGIAECADVEIADQDAELLEASREGVGRALARALGLDRAASGLTGARSPRRLGERAFGDEAAVFYFAPWVDSRGLGTWLDAVSVRERGRAVALVVARERAVRSDLAAMLRRAGLSLLGLDRLLRVDGRQAVVDLADFVVDRRFAGIDPGRLLWPRYRLVLDPEGSRCWLGGQRLPLDGKPKSALMLEALARSPGRVVTRSELCRSVWPESYGGRGTLEIDWDRRIRGLKRELGKLLEGAEAGAADLLETIPGDETVGGYRLALEARSVKWWSK